MVPSRAQRLVRFALAATAAVAAVAAPRPAAADPSDEIAWDPPEVVYGGNAVSVLAPFQIGIVGYLPKARVGLAYDRQIEKAHWLHVQAAFLADRGDFRNFRMDACGFEEADGSIPAGLCEPGSVLGVDAVLGYTHKFYLPERSYLVPFVRAGIGISWWKLPRLRGGDANREQIRTDTLALYVLPAGGLRWFVTSDVGLGVEVGLPIGGAIHRELPKTGNVRRRGGFLLGIQTLLGLEIRF